jgi:hypothetical protein
LSITGAAELELFGPSNAAVSLASGSTGTLKLDASSLFGGTVAGLTNANFLDLADLPYQGNSAPTYNNGTLSVVEGGSSVNISLLGSYLAGSFAASSDLHGGTLVTDPPPSGSALLAATHG